MDAAWLIMNAGWVVKAKDTISSCRNNHNQAIIVLACQVGKEKKNFLDWVDARWQGNFVATRRFHYLLSIPGLRDRIESDINDSEMDTIGKLLPLLELMANITQILSGERITEAVPITVHYGTHLRIILWFMISFIFKVAGTDIESIHVNDDWGFGSFALLSSTTHILDSSSG